MFVSFLFLLLNLSARQEYSVESHAILSLLIGPGIEWQTERSWIKNNDKLPSDGTRT